MKLLLEYGANVVSHFIHCHIMSRPSITLIVLKDASSLFIASQLGFAEIVKLLVDHGAQVNDPYEVNSWSYKCHCLIICAYIII